MYRAPMKAKDKRCPDADVPHPKPGCFAWRAHTLEIKPAPFLRTQEEEEEAAGGEPELNQCHVTWFKAAVSTPPAG